MSQGRGERQDPAGLLGYVGAGEGRRIVSVVGLGQGAKIRVIWGAFYRSGRGLSMGSRWAPGKGWGEGQNLAHTGLDSGFSLG